MPVASSGFRFRWLLLLVGVVALGVMSLILSRPRAKPEEPVVALSELQRLGGVLVRRDDTNRVFTGWVTETYGDGTLKSRSHVAGGKLEGKSEGWTAAGVLQIREHYVAGISEGEVTKWYPDGSKLSQGLARGGKFEGTFRRWHTNGVISEEQQLVAGQPHGISRAWHPSGSPKAEVIMENGVVRSKQFWKDGEQPALAATNSKVTSP